MSNINHTHCCYCRRKFGPGNPKTNDHFVPQSRGGRSGDNILQACRECNEWKADRMPMFWLDRVQHYLAKKTKYRNYSLSDYRQIIGSIRHFVKQLGSRELGEYKYKLNT